MAEPAEAQSTDSTPPSQSVNTTVDDQGRMFDADFADDEANITLKSSDNIHYRLSSYTLRTTSGFFRGMMTLPRNESANTQKGDIVPMGEPSRVLGVLFRMVAGLECPVWQSLGDLEEVLAAAEKYDMKGPISTIRTVLPTSTFIEQPLQAYSIAARYGWEEEAKAISKHTLSLSIYEEEHMPMLERIPSKYLLRLQLLHRRRRDKFSELVNMNGGLGVQHCTYCGIDVQKKTLYLQCNGAGNGVRDGSKACW